jgi:hypothetical protein
MFEDSDDLIAQRPLNARCGVYTPPDGIEIVAI